jgi:hypothetical protein
VTVAESALARVGVKGRRLTNNVGLKADSNVVYVMSYFAAGPTTVESDGLHMAVSDDGFHFQPRAGSLRCEAADNVTAVDQNKNVKWYNGTMEAGADFMENLFLVPEVGDDRFSLFADKLHCNANKKVLRDPQILWDPRAHRFHMIWTTGWSSATIGHATSDDLVHWSKQSAIEVTQGLYQVRNTWAPEAFFDDAAQKFVLVWSTSHGRAFENWDDYPKYPHKMYYAMTEDFVNFTAPALLFDPGHSAIDVTMTEDAGKYYIVYKNEEEGQKTLHLAEASTSTGPYSYLMSLSNATGPKWAEGPSIFKRDGEFVIVFDQFMAGTYAAISAPTMRGPWRSADIEVPLGARHATVLSLERDAVGKLLTLPTTRA